MHLVIRFLGLVVMRVFYRVIAASHPERIPRDGPVLAVANHPNGLLDPLVAQAAVGRRLAFLAKSTFFRNPVGRATMRAFDAIPVYRPRDGEDASRNEETFRRCRALLARRGWLMLFPEGTSHSDPQLKPLKTGAARIALQAEAASGFTLGLRLLPLGLLYEDKTLFRSRVGVAIGEPLGLGHLKDAFAADERAAVEALTAEIDRALSDVVLEADSRELWNGFVAVAAWTSRDGGRDVARVETRARELALAYRRLQADDPARADRLVEQTRRFAAALRAVGVDDPFSLESRPLRVAGAAAFLLPVLLTWPVALVGALLGWLPYRLVGLLANRFGREDDLVGTFKALGGLLVILPWWLVQGVVAGWLLGPLAGLSVSVLGPLAGFVAVRFEERLRLRREALRGLWLRSSDAAVADRLRERREELARAVAAELDRPRAA